MIDKIIAGVFNLMTGDATPEQAKFLKVFLWRAIVTFHMASAWGMLAFIGISGFTTAQETSALKDEVKQIKEASALQTRLGIVREIRIQASTMCSSPDMGIRNAIMNTIDRLREDYRSVTKETYPEVRCP